MNWDDLRVVLALDRAGAVSAAARALGMDRTTTSRRLKALEVALGTRLVTRGSGGMRPSAAAHAIAARAAEMEASALAIGRELAGKEGSVTGTVRVTATEALGTRLLAPALATLCARHPGLTAEVDVEARAVSLARGEADLAVRLLPPVEPTSSGRRIGSVAYGAYVARGAARDARPGRVGLLLWSGPIPGSETEWLIRRYPEAPVRLRTNSTAALLLAAVEGAGIAVLPCFVGDSERLLVRLDAPGELPSSGLWVIAHRDLRRSARVATVREEVERVLRASRPALEGRTPG
jgi:DNA-binding transcriptional LysR family regulator